MKNIVKKILIGILIFIILFIIFKPRNVFLFKTNVPMIIYENIYK